MWPDSTSWISLADCVDGNLYQIEARNASVGIYNAKNQAFFISRIKFSDNFIDIENHWDTGEPHGTAKPLKDLGPVDPSMVGGYRIGCASSEDRLLKFLNEKEQRNA